MPQRLPTTSRNHYAPVSPGLDHKERQLTIARRRRKGDFPGFVPPVRGGDPFADLMRLSKKTEYALRALFAIARAYPRDNASQRIEHLSKQENIPVKFLEQILLSLRHAGLLSSKRGVGGGYRLARPPGEITVGEVIRTLDGPLTPLPCAVNVTETSADQKSGAPARHRDPRCTCPDERTCPVRVLMVAVQEQLTALLDGRSLEDILREVPASENSLSFEI